MLRLTWEWSAGELHSIYRGPMSSLRLPTPYDHREIGQCGISGGEATVPEAQPRTYYLVVGACGSLESSFGRDSLGAERSAATTPCP